MKLAATIAQHYLAFGIFNKYLAFIIQIHYPDSYAFYSELALM